MMHNEIKDEAIKIVTEIFLERMRQIEVEGWTPYHDDTHTDGELAAAASVYADCANYNAMLPLYGRVEVVHVMIPRDYKWPFKKESFKPTPDDRERELVKAGALIIAEIQRLRRAKEQQNA